jgi:hypothetical protein
LGNPDVIDESVKKHAGEPLTARRTEVGWTIITPHGYKTLRRTHQFRLPFQQRGIGRRLAPLAQRFAMAQ